MNWVSVTDRLPTEDDGVEFVVWLHLDGSPYPVSYWDVAYYRDGHWTLAEIDGAGGGECHPTHWMVPLAPETDEERQRREVWESRVSGCGSVPYSGGPR